MTGVGSPGTPVTNWSLTPYPFSAWCTKRPNGSFPVRVITAALRPRRAAATATLVALPPRYFPKVVTSSRATPTCSG